MSCYCYLVTSLLLRVPNVLDKNNVLRIVLAKSKVLIFYQKERIDIFKMVVVD